MIFGLIGMSGVGKTTWANRLAAAGFTCLHCDDLIAERLQAHGVVSDTSITAIGHWMSIPNDNQYPAREALYLAYETDVLQIITASLATNPNPHLPLLIDLTGSAIYVAPPILAALRRHTTIVYLAATAAQHADLLGAYLASPRPVLWNGHYQPIAGETSQAALARCYANLLRDRASRYAALAHVTLYPDLHHNPNVTANDFLRHVLAEIRQ